MAQIPSINIHDSLDDLRKQFSTLFEGITPMGTSVDIPTRSGTRKALVYQPHDSNASSDSEASTSSDDSSEVNGSSNPRDPMPVLFNLHGGGFIIGAPIQNDAICQYISQTLGIVVVSPDYRLAPEFPYPAALDDVFDVASYVKTHAEEFSVNPERMAIVGHSAGGNLAAACCLLAARERTVAFRCCILDYAHLNVTGTDTNGNGGSAVLSSDTVSFFNNAYRGKHTAEDPLVSPIFASDGELADFPPCLNITPEHGPYRDDNEAFAKRLVAAGVEVLSKRFLGVDHGFTETYFFPADVSSIPSGINYVADEAASAAAKEAVDLMLWELRRHLLAV